MGAAGVAIDPAPVKGIVKLPLSTLRVSFPALRNPANIHGAHALMPEQFHYAFTNTLTEQEAEAVYDRYEAPGARSRALPGWTRERHPHAPTRVNFRNDTRAPLLRTAGGRDHIAPASLTRTNFELYEKSKAMTAFEEFPDRSHFTIGALGWEQVADYPLDWATSHSAAFAERRPRT